MAQPGDDLSADFEDNRDVHYAALGLPQKVQFHHRAPRSSALARADVRSGFIRATGSKAA